MLIHISTYFEGINFRWYKLLRILRILGSLRKFIPAKCLKMAARESLYPQNCILSGMAYLKDTA